MTPEAALEFLTRDATKTTDDPNEDITDAQQEARVIPPVINQEPDCHYFSREFASKFGVKEAIVMKFLSYKVRQAAKNKSRKTFHNNKFWYFDSIDAIAGRYKYIPRSTLGDILKRLEGKSLVEVGNYNRKKYDRTRWYTARREVMNAADMIPWLAFNIEVAAKIGIPEAVLYNNLSYYVGLKRCPENPNPVHPMSPSMLKVYLPFSKSTIKAALHRLVAEGYIFKDPESKTLYGLVSRDNPEGRNPDKVGQKPDEVGQKSDETGQNPVNNTHYKAVDNPLEVHIEKSTFKTSEAPPPRDSPILLKPSQDTATTLNPTSTSQHGEAVTTEDDKHPKAKYTWKQLLASDDEIAKSIEDNNPLVEYLANASSLFASKFSVSDIIELRDIEDDEVRVSVLHELLRPRFDAVFERPETLRNLPSISRNQVEVHVLRMLAAAVNQLIDPCGRAGFHRVPAIHRRICDLSSEMKALVFRHESELATLEHQKREHQSQEEFRKRMAKFRSVDEDNYDDPDLSPAVKARAFRNYVQSLNAAGVLASDGSFKENLFKWDTRSDEIALKFFELNPYIRVCELFTPLQWVGLASLLETPDSDEEFDPHFHARRGNDVGFFFKHLDKVIDQLELTEHYNHVLYLSIKNEEPPPCPIPIDESLESMGAV